MFYPSTSQTFNRQSLQQTKPSADQAFHEPSLLYVKP